MNDFHLVSTLVILGQGQGQGHFKVKTCYIKQTLTLPMSFKLLKLDDSHLA